MISELVIQYHSICSNGAVILIGLCTEDSMLKRCEDIGDVFIDIVKSVDRNAVIQVGFPH